ncbi:MAG: nucleoid-associated protein [Bacteroidetes bacterium]|nr:nucleoid-associated protein [Bacteroidota bacterium]
MIINRVAIHEIEKLQGKTGSTLTLFDNAVDHTDEKVIRLITELNNRYRNRIEIYGVFDKEEPTAFHTSFDHYYKDQKDKIFVKFTKSACRDLKSRIDSVAGAKGGYLIFAHYEMNQNFVGVFLVRNTTGISFRKNTKGDKFDLDNVQHIDFENLAMACRVNVEAYDKPDVRYLSFLNKTGDETSDYFARWISSSDLESNKEDTQQLFSLFNQVSPPYDDDLKRNLTKQELMERAYGLIKTHPKKTVNIRNLSEQLFHNSEYLPNFILQNNIAINGEFKSHASSLRRFAYVKAKADEVELSFSFKALNKTVVFDPNDDGQLIIKSRRLVELVKLSIEEEE